MRALGWCSFSAMVWVHHGYFIPRISPDTRGASFPGLGYDGPTGVAVAMFTFPNGEAYRTYREAVASDTECKAMATLVQKAVISPAMNVCSFSPSR